MKARGEVIDAKTGLMVRADRAGAVTFSFRYRAGSARRRVTLGRYPVVSLAEGRAAVGRMREQVRNGADPQQERREARRTELTFDALAEGYLEHYAKRQKASWKNDEGYLRRARRAWGKRNAGSITRQDAARLLFDVVVVAPVSANRLRSVLVKLFGWAVDSGLLTASPMLGVGAREPSRNFHDQIKAVAIALSSVSQRERRPGPAPGLFSLSHCTDGARSERRALRLRYFTFRFSADSLPRFDTIS